ncbi:aspartyl-phosphate phosphatase Spo0E family protein [Priestia megaterium]|uniref:aspartyl-phosphate phosphatase Spo0E family protein n=1 Tax=Priestia megaterium TaxID=1404 RepID=UPI0009E4D7B7|nr:aspartyl-phosphate phosphatase Spo0E family protein [Priestia megaterium]
MSEKQLLNKIELVRVELIKSVQSHGYHNEETIRISKYLDGLIIKIQKYYYKSKNMIN